MWSDFFLIIFFKFTLTASYVEVYNDEIFDLLANKSKIILKKIGSLDHAENLVRKRIESSSTVRYVLPSKKIFYRLTKYS